MDIAKKNDSHIEKYNIEVLHKGTTSNVIIRIKFIHCLQFYSIYKLFTFSLPTFGDNKTNTRSLCMLRCHFDYTEKPQTAFQH